MFKQSRQLFSEFLKKNSRVGSVTPSSRFLAKKMLDPIDFSKDIVIAEYGPGTGVFTKRIIEKMTPNSRFYVFELNHDFITILKEQIQDKRTQIIEDSAANIAHYLAKDEVKEVDYIVSSLPLSLLPLEVRDKIVETSFAVLNENGIMTQFQYSQQCKKNFQAVFPSLETKFTALNVPPAFVYICKKKK